MNNRTIGNLLLTIGTIVASLAAANSQRATRVFELGSGSHSGEYLGQEVGASATFSEDSLAKLASAIFIVDVLKSEDKEEYWGYSAGTQLKSSVVKDLIKLGFETVPVDRIPGGVAGEQPLDRSLNDLQAALEFTLENRELQDGGLIRFHEYLVDEIRVPKEWTEEQRGELKKAKKLVDTVPTKSREYWAIPAGLELTSQVCDDLRSAGHDQVLVQTPPLSAVEVTLASDEPLEGQVLASAVPSLLHEGTISAGDFVTDKLEERIRTDGKLSTLMVERNKQFSFANWGYKLPFFGGVIAMILGVILKRKSANSETEADLAAQDSSQTPSAVLSELVSRLETLVPTVDDLSAAEIKDSVDPLLEEVVPAFLETGVQLQRAHGGATFAKVYSPFANGERKLSRAWSAAVDEVPAESRASLRLALEYFKQAQAALPS